MELTLMQRGLVGIVHMLEKRKKTPDRENIAQIVAQYPEYQTENWETAIKPLIEAGLLLETDGVYTLTAEGTRIVEELIQHRSSEAMLKYETSKTMNVYCEKLYGLNLCQLDMTPLNQLQKLLDLLQLKITDSVLDLGCGSGKVAEYIHDLTQATMTGLDYISGVILRAQERTKAKTDHLKYVVGNMNSLDFPDNSFDVIIAIDTVYFVADLAEFVGKLKQITKSGGQMGIFYDQMIKENEDRALLRADQTKLAQCLTQHALPFQTYEFTAEEREFWPRQARILEEMKADFLDEGIQELYDARLRETTHMMKFVDDDRVSRYLYHIRVDKTP